MGVIELLQQEAAVYFNQAQLNLKAIDSGLNEKQTCFLDFLTNHPEVCEKAQNFIFNNKNISKSPRNDINSLILKLVDLRNYYSHYVRQDNCKELNENENDILEKYYSNAIEATGSDEVKLKIISKDQSTGITKLTEAGVLFWLCMFLKRSQAIKLISSISGFKRNDAQGLPRRNLFTYYSMRDGYKVLPEMKNHFLLFQLVNHLVKEDESIGKLKADGAIGRGKFFARIGSTFLTLSGIVKELKFYNYPSKRLIKQRGQFEPDENVFEWKNTFQNNSYFEIDGQKGVISEDELKELCYAVLCQGKGNFAAGQIKKFLADYKKSNTLQDVRNSDILEERYFPANYFSQANENNAKEGLIERLDKTIESYKSHSDKLKAYDKIKVVMDHINGSLGAGNRLKEKDYKRYMNMVRFWSSEKGNIEREFEAKELANKFKGSFWICRDLEAAYNYAKVQVVEMLEDLNLSAGKIADGEFDKYRRIDSAGDIGKLKKIATEFGLVWEEKDWAEYGRQVNKEITENRKLSIMRQRVTAKLKKKHGIENLKLRIKTDSEQSRKAVFNRIAIPRGFVKKHILHSNVKTMKQLREMNCKIKLSKNYKCLSRQFYDKKDLENMSLINDLYEKNKLIGLMVEHQAKRVKVRLLNEVEPSIFSKTKVEFKLSNNVTESIQMSKYPSLVYVIGRKYIDEIAGYKFAGKAPDSVLEKIKVIEEQRMDFIKKVLDFEKWLFDNKIMDKSGFTDVKTHLGFRQICDMLVTNDWSRGKLDALRFIRNDALHGKMPNGKTFCDGIEIVESLKKESIKPKVPIKVVDYIGQKKDDSFKKNKLRNNRCDRPQFEG